MTDKTESGAKVPVEELDEFDEFAKSHPEQCVELTKEWKEQLLKKLEEEMSKNRSES